MGNRNARNDLPTYAVIWLSLDATYITDDKSIIQCEPTSCKNLPTYTICNDMLST